MDLFATRYNHKLPQFVSPVPDPQAWAVGALSLSWEGLDPYAFPPAAQHALVLGSSGNVQSDPSVPAQHTKLSVPAIQPGPSQEPVESKPTCLAPRASTIKEQGFLEAVSARIEAPQRRSTRSVYEAKWTIFTIGASVIRWTSGYHL